MLHVEGVRKSFGGVVALDECSFTVPRNTITALIGPNGAGKTTLLDVVSGLVRPERGMVLLAGRPLVGRRADEIARAGVSRTWQQVRLFRHLTVLDHLVLAESDEDASFVRNLVAQPAVDREAYQRVAERFGIGRPLDTVVTDLSYGQRKLLQLAMALQRAHRLLLLDEPVAGVNAVLQERIERLLLGLKERDETVVVVEHDMEFVQRLADHVVVMDEGRVLAAGAPHKVLSDRWVIEAYLGA